MKTVLVDVDSQFDFVHPEGRLYVEGIGVSEAIEARLRRAMDEGTPIIGSVDSHAYDAWEFASNGGPFPEHCVKGTAGWLRVHASLPGRTRFIPMLHVEDDVVNLVGEAVRGEGTRRLNAAALAAEAIAGVGLYFEKEVYSLFSNPAATPVLDAVVRALGGAGEVVFEVIGYCTGGYCVDAAAKGLVARGYRVRVVETATAAIGGVQGVAKSKAELTAAGVQWVGA